MKPAMNMLSRPTARPPVASPSRPPANNHPSGQHPRWLSLTANSSDWSLRDGRLIHRDAPSEEELAVEPAARTGRLQQAVVNHFWAAQKNSRSVRRVLRRLIAELPSNEWGLNLGSGETSFGANVLNVDIYQSPNVDIVNQGFRLPFLDDQLSLAISQEVLEHVQSPRSHIDEVHRVLKPDGLFFCQLPFVIGYHPGPTDYWRFTKESYQELFPPGRWKIVELDLSLGHGSGFYRMLVEFVAVNFSIVSERLYRPTKALGSVLFSPLQWLDALTRFSKQKDRIPGGYYCVAQKLGD